MSRFAKFGYLAVCAAALLSLSVLATDLKPAPANVKAADWPQFRGPHRDGLSPEKGLLHEWPKDGPPLVFKATGLGAGFSSVSVVGNRIFTMGDVGDSSYVFALDRANGDKVWSAKVGKPGGNYTGTRCTPTVDSDRVYALGQFGDFVCLDVATGKEIWRKNFPKDFGGQSGGWNYTESPLIDGDKLVCTPGGKNATIVALDKKTGDVIWKAALNDRADYASIVISEACGVRQYVQLLAGGVVGVAAKDGKFLWKYDRLGHNTANAPNPIVKDDYVFCTAGYDHKGGALLHLTKDGDGIKATEEYYVEDLRNRHGGVVLVGDYVYGDTDDSGRPFCAEWKTGKVKWQRDKKTPGGGSAAVVYADGDLYLRYQNGYVALVEATPEGYKEKSTFKIPNCKQPSWPHPVVVGGRLYLREQDTLWVYDVRAK
jgi:outer membrane protein assembly factor BamB